MSATVAAVPASQRVPVVRVRPVPRSEPPSDDELRAAGLLAPPMSAPALPLRMPTRRRPSPRRTGSTRPAGAAATRSAQPSSPDPAAGAPAVSPARLATRRFLAVCVEVLGGFRPVTQLRALCVPERFDDITRRLRAHTPGAVPGPASPAGSPTPRRTPTGAPPRPGRVGQSGAERVTVRRVQVCEPVDGVAEVAAVLARRDHVWAMAVRLERHKERWLCAHLEFI